MSGPFKGMYQSSEGVFSVWYPRILGVYERELFPVFEEIVNMKPARIVDVGAAEGYLAIGFMKRLPDVQMVAFEMLERGREVIHYFADKNGFDEGLTIMGEADEKELSAVLAEEIEGDQVLIMDIEGYEEVLLNPKKIVGLGKTHVLVELHEFAVPNVGELIKKRFDESHDILEISVEERSTEDLPMKLKGWPRRVWRELLDEYRPPGVSWLWMQPKA